VIPIVDAVIVKVRLANLGPVLPGIGAGISILPQTLVNGVAVSGVSPLAPCRINRDQGGVDRVAEFVHPDALVVVTVDRQAEQVLLAETGRLAARARTRSFW